jgi:hypothetical protein
MVDEVAWGVGWGAEGDDITPDPEPLSACSHAQPSKGLPSLPPSAPSPSSSSSSLSSSAPASASSSRSPSPPIVGPLSCWQQPDALVQSHAPERELRPSLGTARRRSVKRAKRSQSRTTSLMDQSFRASSRSRGVSISLSHPPPPMPLLHDAVRSPTASVPSSISSSSRSSLLDGHETGEGAEDLARLTRPAPPLPPQALVNRGRRPSIRDLGSSRSPSPSVLPSTPVDAPRRNPLYLSSSLSPTHGVGRGRGIVGRLDEIADEQEEEVRRGHRQEEEAEEAEDVGEEKIGRKAVDVVMRGRGRRGESSGASHSPSPLRRHLGIFRLGSKSRHRSPEADRGAAEPLPPVEAGGTGSRRAGSMPPAPLMWWTRGRKSGANGTSPALALLADECPSSSGGGGARDGFLSLSRQTRSTSPGRGGQATRPSR